MKHLDDAEAAVASCVSVLAAVTDQPEAVLIKWLDLYYQVRHAYELERGTTPEPQLLLADEVWPALREILREELRSAAEERIAAAACALPRNDEAGGASLSPTGEGDLPPAILAASPGGGKGPAPWVRYKQKVAAKLAAARARGVPIVRIAEASGGALSEGRVIDAINAGLLNQKEWSALDKALDLVTAAAAGAE